MDPDLVQFFEFLSGLLTVVNTFCIVACAVALGIISSKIGRIASTLDKIGAAQDKRTPNQTDDNA